MGKALYDGRVTLEDALNVAAVELEENAC